MGWAPRANVRRFINLSDIQTDPLEHSSTNCNDPEPISDPIMPGILDIAMIMITKNSRYI